MQIDDRDYKELQALEESLWTEATRFDSGYMDRILAKDFCEVGKSGRTYNRQEVLSVPPSRINATIPLAGFSACLLSEGVALVCYQSEQTDDRSTQRAIRSSIWVRKGSRWVLRFHQGTPAAEK